MKIGVRAHDHGRMEIEELARFLKDEGYQAAQLVLPKVFAGIGCYEDITPAHLERIRNAFEKNEIDIPVFGCDMDLGNPDPDVRAYVVNTMKKCLAYSKVVGAKMVGTETAYPHLSREEKDQWRPYMMESIEVVLDVMEQIGDEEHLRMIFDASNLLQFPDTTDQKSYWSEWLAQTGKYIDAMHIKDFTLDAEGNYCPALLGEGVIQFPSL